jgi:hypothetical protein
MIEHRGVRFAIRIGIAREQWRVAIYFPRTRLPVEKTVFGPREDAIATARSMIDARLKKLSALGSQTKPPLDNGQTD